MARFNTGARTLVISNTFTLAYAFTGGIITLSGAGSYTVSIASPVSFPGTTQVFYNSTVAPITIATPVGQIRGPGFTAGAFQTIEAGGSMTIVSDGSNYVIVNTEGNIVVGSTATFSGTLTAPTAQGSTANSGTLTIRSTSSATKAAAGILMTENITSTSTSTGTLVVTGGVGVGENLNVGGTAIRFTGNAASTGTTSGTLVVTGGVGVGGAVYAGSLQNTPIGNTTRSTGAFTTLTSNSTVTMTGGTSSTSTGSGQLQVTGGVGISENLWVGGYIDAASIQDTPIGTVTRSSGAFTSLTANAAVTLTQNSSSSNTASGTLVVTGGVGISENLYVGGATVRFTGNTGSSSSGSGTLVVTGGLGVSQNCYVGSTLVAASISETSSMTLKHTIMPIENALEKILNLEGVTYYRKVDDSFEAGLIAENVNKVVPELVGKNSEGIPETVYYTKISAYLIEAVKTLKQELDSLKGKN